MLSPFVYVLAQETKTANIALSFSQTDTTKTCTATVTSNGLAVAGPEVHLYVKRMYSLLPIGKVAAADSQGVVKFNFPMDLPGDKNGMLTVIAKIEKDDNYGNAETQAEVKWGVSPTNESYNWNDRSLSASREKAPMLLVIASVVIIVIIWGTIFYIIFQLFRIKKAARIVKAATGAV
jgi:hypothetical protein